MPLFMASRHGFYKWVWYAGYHLGEGDLGMRKYLFALCLGWSMVSMAAPVVDGAAMPVMSAGISTQKQVEVLTEEVGALALENERLRAGMMANMVPSVSVPNWFVMKGPVHADARSLMLLMVLLCAAFLWWHGLDLGMATVLSGEEDEYNFLETEAAIPAKLDLAQAYMAMGDVDSARMVLTEVLVAGNSDQRDQAQRIMGQVSHLA